MRPLKIALLSRWYWEENRRYAANGGGAVRQLAEAVAALGHEVVVLSQSADAGPLDKDEIGPLEVWLSPREKKRDFLTGLRDKWAKQTYRHRKVYSDALTLRDFLARRGPFDVLWAQSEEPDGLVAAMAAQLGAKLPPVLTQIQALRYRFENGTPVFNEKPALGLAFQKATRILANSELVAHSLNNYTSVQLTPKELRDKVRVVHPNLTRQFLQSAEEVSTAHVPMHTAPRILFFGALNEGKGATVFMEAIGKTVASKQGATFAVIGDFTEKNPAYATRWTESVAAARARLDSDKIELLGKISAFEVIRQVKLANLVVLPSLFDAFSRVLVETLILGRPVITTDLVGAWPLVEEHKCGLVVTPNDPDALATAIDVALDPATPYALNAQNIAHRLLHEFSPDAIARQVVHHLSEIAE